MFCSFLAVYPPLGLARLWKASGRSFSSHCTAQLSFGSPVLGHPVLKCESHVRSSPIEDHFWTPCPDPRVHKLQPHLRSNVSATVWAWRVIPLPPQPLQDTLRMKRVSALYSTPTFFDLEIFQAYTARQLDLHIFFTYRKRLSSWKCRVVRHCWLIFAQNLLPDPSSCQPHRTMADSDRDDRAGVLTWGGFKFARLLWRHNESAAHSAGFYIKLWWKENITENCRTF